MPSTPIPEERLLADLRRVADQLGKSPTETEYKSRGEYWPATYRNRFGTWNDAKAAAGLETYPKAGRGDR